MRAGRASQPLPRAPLTHQTGPSPEIRAFRDCRRRRSDARREPNAGLRQSSRVESTLAASRPFAATAACRSARAGAVRARLPHGRRRRSRRTPATSATGSRSDRRVRRRRIAGATPSFAWTCASIGGSLLRSTFRRCAEQDTTTTGCVRRGESECPDAVSLRAGLPRPVVQVGRRPLAEISRFVATPKRGSSSRSGA